MKRHALGKKHINSCSKIRDNSGNIKFQQQQLNANSWQNAIVKNQTKDSVTTAETLFALMVAEEDIPYSIGDTACDIFPSMFPDSKIAKEFSCSRKKISYIISDGIGPFLKEKIITDILKSGAFYTIQIDETPIHEKRVQQLDVLIRYYSEKYKQVIVDHLQSFHIGHGTSDNLLDCVKVALTELPSEKFLSFYSDGPNVMKALKGKLKSINPQLLDIGECSLHKVHNAFGAALNAFGNDIESMILDLYYFFKRSAAQSEDFKQLQLEMNITQHVFMRHLSSRWLTLNESLYRFIEQFPALKAFFKRESKKFSTRESERWQRLCVAFSDKTVYAKALFLQNCSNLFSGFLLLFQKEEPLIHIIYDEMVSLVKKILGRFLVESAFKDNKGDKLKSIDLHQGQNWLPKPEIGSDTLVQISELSATEKSNFFLGARAFYIACAEYLLKSLPLENKFLERMKCLHPAFRYEQSSVTCIKSLAVAVPSVIAQSNVSDVIDEWIIYQSDTVSHSSITERIDKYWTRVFDDKDLSGKLKYKYLPILIKALLVLAHGNADCERGFSTNKNIISARSSLCIASINGLRKIKSEVRKCGGIKKVEVCPQLVACVKKSWKTYEMRTKAEQNIKEKQEEKHVVGEKLDELKEEARILKKRQESVELMLKKAETAINEGLQKKSFDDIECGNIILKESRKKLSEIAILLKENEKQQTMYNSNSNPQKRKKIV